MWNLKGRSALLQIKDLNAMTSYVVDVMVRYEGIEGAEKSMDKPFVFRIKGEKMIFYACILAEF